jgi:hypothetical protein
VLRLQTHVDRDRRARRKLKALADLARRTATGRGGNGAANVTASSARLPRAVNLRR